MTRKRKDDDQLDFYPAWRERLDELRARLRSIEPRAANLTVRRWERCRELLMAVASYEQGGRCRATAEQLLTTARRGTLSFTKVWQVYEARRDLERLGLLGVERDYSSKRSADALWVVDEEVDRLAAHTRELRRRRLEPRPKPRPKPTLNNPKQPETTRGGDYFLERLPKANANLSEELKQSSSSSLPSNGARTADTARGAGARRTLPSWLEAEEEVFICGVTLAERAVAAARSRGASAADVLRLVAWWRERRSGWSNPPGALYARLVHHNARLAIGEGWPRDGHRDAAARRAEFLRAAAEQDRRRAAFAAERAAARASFERQCDSSEEATA